MVQHPPPNLNTSGPGFINGRLEEAVGLHGEEVPVLTALQHGLVTPQQLAAADVDFLARCVRGYFKEKPRNEGVAAALKRILEWRAHAGIDEVRTPRATRRRAAQSSGQSGVGRGEPRTWLAAAPRGLTASTTKLQLLLKRLPKEAVFHKGWASSLGGEDCFGHTVFCERIQARPPTSRLAAPHARRALPAGHRRGPADEGHVAA